jgi:hypothetical protein
MRILGKSVWFWVIVAALAFVAYHYWVGRQAGTSTAAAAKTTTRKATATR